MFSVKSFNKLVFFGITFFLVNFFFGADDAVRKPDDHAQVSNKLSTRSVQQDQENRSPNYSVEIVLPESVQKLKDRAQELLATIAQRKDVQEVTDQIVAAKDRLQDFLQEKLAIARPKLVTLGGDDEFGLQISAMALPFPGGSSGGGCKSSGSSQGSSSVPYRSSPPLSGTRPIVDRPADKVRYMIHIGSNGYNELDDIFDTRPQQRSAEELYKKRKLEEKIRDQEKQMQIMATHQAEEQAEIVAWLQARILAEKDEEEALQAALLAAKVQTLEKEAVLITTPIPTSTQTPIQIATSITNSVTQPVEIPELTQCQLFKQKLALALAVSGRSDLRLTIDRDVFCKEEFLDENKKREDDGKLSGLKSVAYLGNAVAVLELGECVVRSVQGAGIGVFSNIGSQSTGVKKGWFAESQYAEKILNFPKYCKESRLEFLERTKSPEEIKEYAKIWFNKIYQLSPIARTFPPDQLITAYSGFAETHFVIVLQDYEGVNHEFVIPYVDRLPAYLLPTDPEVWQKHVDLERRVEESDRKYAELCKKRQKN